MSKKLELRKFDVATCKPHTTNILIGKRGTGKSVLLRDILFNMRHNFDIGVCCTPTMETAEMFREFVPESLIYNDYDASVLQRIVAQQRLRQESGKDIDSIFIVLDDCGYEKSMFSSKNSTIRDIFMNGRHYKITLFICLQYCVDIPPALRANTDYVYALREPVAVNQKKLHDFFFGIIDSYANFKKIFACATQNYECLVTCNSTASNDVTDCVFWYKASIDHPEFRLCSPKYWVLNKKYHRTKQELKQEKSRNQPAITESGPIEIITKSSS